MNPTIAPRRTPTKPAGWIYLIHTWDDPQMYVGQTVTPVWSRVNAHRKNQPWGPRIRPGRDGYTILRRVESSGDPAIDAVLLDLAEAEEIQRWEPSDNANRPDPAVFQARLQALRAGVPVAPRFAPAVVAERSPVGRWRGAPRARRPVPWRGVGFAALSVLCVIVGLRLSAAWPNPADPWVVVPIAAILGPAAIVGIYRRCTRPRPRRRRTRRGRR